MPALHRTQGIIAPDIGSALFSRNSSHFNKKFSNSKMKRGHDDLGQEVKFLRGG